MATPEASSALSHTLSPCASPPGSTALVRNQRPLTLEQEQAKERGLLGKFSHLAKTQKHLGEVSKAHSRELEETRVMLEKISSERDDLIKALVQDIDGAQSQLWSALQATNETLAGLRDQVNANARSINDRIKSLEELQRAATSRHSALEGEHSVLQQAISETAERCRGADRLHGSFTERLAAMEAGLAAERADLRCSTDELRSSLAERVAALEALLAGGAEPWAGHGGGLQDPGLSRSLRRNSTDEPRLLAREGASDAIPLPREDSWQEIFSGTLTAASSHGITPKPRLSV
uniref:Cilia- and flagella-associated protein 157 n=1 Tax=Pyrodinium bahamense TaxID=73915 RepID=A0A7S0AH82_9DINO